MKTLISNLYRIFSKMLFIFVLSLCVQIGLSGILSFGSAMAQGQAAVQDGVVEISYVWKRGDTLSSALFDQGIGRNKGGARIYGKSGWVRRNSDFYGRTNWDGIEEGTIVKLIVPKMFATAQAGVPVEVQKQAPQRVQVEVAKPVSRPVAKIAPKQVEEESLEQETVEKEEVAAEEATEEESDETPPVLSKKPAVKEDAKATADATKSKSKISTRTSASGSKKLGKEHEVAIALTIVAFGIGVYIYRQRRIKSLELKMGAVSNSFLSWMVLSGSHQSEHIIMAETLFVGPTSERAINAYEMMGFLAKDLEMMKLLDERLKVEHALPAIDYSLEALQEEFLFRFMKVSPTVYFRMIAFSSSPFLQIAALKVLKHHYFRNADNSFAPVLGNELVIACSKYANLRNNAAVKEQILDFIASLDSVMKYPKVG